MRSMRPRRNIRRRSATGRAGCARWGGPPGNGDWVLWQYHNAGHVDGIESEVDLNVLRDGADELKALAGG